MTHRAVGTSIADAADPKAAAIDLILEAASPRGLEDELGRMKTSQLLKRARSDGVDEGIMAEIDDSADQRAAAIDAIVLLDMRRRLEPELLDLLEPAREQCEPEPQRAGYGFSARTSSATASASNGVEGLGSPRPAEIEFLTGTELSRAAFVSHSRRDAGALNAVYAMVGALRLVLKADGAPYSQACFTGDVVLWLDKEQMARSGGADWSRILADVQNRAMATLFFLSNAYCGSEECLKELQYADMKKFKHRVPIFLEPFVNDEETFAKKKLAQLCDADMQEFEHFESSKNTIERLSECNNYVCTILSPEKCFSAA